jgi:HEAT repeat protein
MLSKNSLIGLCDCLMATRDGKERSELLSEIQFLINQYANSGADGVSQLIGILGYVSRKPPGSYFGPGRTVFHDILNALEQVHEFAFEPLLTYFRNATDTRRSSVLDTLVRTNTVRMIEPLISALNYPEAEVRSSAKWHLKEIGEPAILQLISALLNPNHSSHAGIAALLGELRDERALQAIIGNLKSPDLRARVAVTEALGCIGAPAIEPLLLALHSPDSEVRTQAKWALIKIGHPTNEPLLAVVSNPKEDAQARVTAVEVLGYIGHHTSVLPLLSLLPASSKNLRTAILLALGRLGDYRAVKPLTAFLNDTDAEVRAAAETGLRWR